MKRIFLLSALVISSFGMINTQTVSAAPQQANQNASPEVKAKSLVSKINMAVSLRGDQFYKVNEACVEYFKKVAASPAEAESLKKVRNEKIKASLAADQLAAWAGFKD